ncbi:MAG: hypothetical protein IPJ61_21330 [Tessaracoccus sp.]|uniref:Ig-like domain-containing protein n=1 Tax=Tessaracoccus sp. TaxID=1971211 RepID=UPI001ECAC4F1|nr:Ig-like domain-containing protein [Tessaracoccus sp.]MBK7823532.1 hypothetical protein [Tessaracoccus sp.]
MTPDRSPTPSTSRLARGALAFFALAAVTCSDDGGPTTAELGHVTGTVWLSEPVRGAQVAVLRWDAGQVGALVCETTTDDSGAFDCAVEKSFGDFVLRARGGQTRDAGAELTLDAGAELRAPVLGFVPAEKRAVTISPASELITAVGLARLAATREPDLTAAVARAHALVTEHLEADPLTLVPAPLASATTLTEPVKLAVFLRGLASLSATVAAEQGLTAVALNTRALVDRLTDDASSAEATLDGVGRVGGAMLELGPNCELPAGCTAQGGPGCLALCVVETDTLRARTGAAVLAWLRTPDGVTTGLDRADVLPWVTHLQQNQSELFGADLPEALDTAGPVVTWAAPAAGQVFTGGAVMLDVTATDALGVASLTVVANLRPRCRSSTPIPAPSASSAASRSPRPRPRAI